MPGGGCTHDYPAIGYSFRDAVELFGTGQHLCGSYCGAGFPKCNIIGSDHPQLGKTEVAHGTGDRTDIQRISRAHQNYADRGFKAIGQERIVSGTRFQACVQSMAKNKITFDTVRKMGMALPGVEESTAYGSPALKVRGKLLACIPIHRSAEPDSLAVRIAFEDRAALMAADPEVYYLTEHYVEHPVVLARLSRIHPDALQDLLAMGLRFVTAKAGVPVSRRKRRE